MNCILIVSRNMKHIETCIGCYIKNPVLGLFWWTISPIPLLEKDQYERIQQLRLIVYHHNLYMWYMVVCIGGMSGIGVLLDVLSWWHKRNI
jgi:hypothetical protein